MPKPCPVEVFQIHGLKVLDSLSRSEGSEHIKVALCGPYGRIKLPKQTGEETTAQRNTRQSTAR